jgi:hypothetical protein
VMGIPSTMNEDSVPMVSLLPRGMEMLRRSTRRGS